MVLETQHPPRGGMLFSLKAHPPGGNLRTTGDFLCCEKSSPAGSSNNSCFAAEKVMRRAVLNGAGVIKATHGIPRQSVLCNALRSDHTNFQDASRHVWRTTFGEPRLALGKCTPPSRKLGIRHALSVETFARLYASDARTLTRVLER